MSLNTKGKKIKLGNTRSEGWKEINRGIPGHQSTISQTLELGCDKSTSCLLSSERM